MLSFILLHLNLFEFKTQYDFNNFKLFIIIIIQYVNFLYNLLNFLIKLNFNSLLSCLLVFILLLLRLNLFEVKTQY